MHRFYLSPDDWPNAALTGPEAHHARSVLRLQPNDRAVVFDGRGREATVALTGLDSGRVDFRVLQESVTPPLRCRITLAQAIPKGKNMDLIVQKAVEIGAAEIFPLLSARTVVQLDPESAAQKQAKWQQVAIEAAKQCGQNWLPQVHAPRTPPDFFHALPALSRAPARDRARDRTPASARESTSRDYDLRLIGSLQPGARHLKEILGDYEHDHEQEQEQEKEKDGRGRRPASVLMLIGPEGDFTPAEIALARSHGCAPLTLGPIILRVETAAIYCLSILSYELLA